MKNILSGLIAMLILLFTCSISQTMAIEAVKQGKTSVIKSWIGSDTDKAVREYLLSLPAEQNIPE